MAVLTGAGDKSFIGGANIGEMSSFPNPVVAEAGSHNTHLACDSMRRFPVPVIARINGYCLGAGMEIATACDMRVASTAAKFGMPEVKFGLPSGMESCLMPMLIGWGKTRELVSTGEMILAHPRVGADLDADAVQQGIRSVGKAHMTDEPHRMLSAFVNRKRPTKVVS